MLGTPLPFPAASLKSPDLSPCRALAMGFLCLGLAGCRTTAAPGPEQGLIEAVEQTDVAQLQELLTHSQSQPLKDRALLLAQIRLFQWRSQVNGRPVSSPSEAQAIREIHQNYREIVHRLRTAGAGGQPLASGEQESPGWMDLGSTERGMILDWSTPRQIHRLVILAPDKAGMAPIYAFDRALRLDRAGLVHGLYGLEEAPRVVEFRSSDQRLPESWHGLWMTALVPTEPQVNDSQVDTKGEENFSFLAPVDWFDDAIDLRDLRLPLSDLKGVEIRVQK